MSGSRSCSNKSAPLNAADDVLEIRQCLFPIREEFFLKEESPDECISLSLGESIPSIPPYTNLKELLGDKGLPPEMIRKLCFCEMLEISAESEEIVGGLVIQAEIIADEVIAVFCSSQFSMGGDRAAQSELISLTDKQLNPFQERKCESVLAGDFKQEKQLQLYFDDANNVTALRQETLADKSESFQGLLASDEGMLVPDGLNILLMRYLILTKYVGTIHTRTIDIHGRVGNCIYQISDIIPTNFKGEVYDTKQVMRTIYYADTSEPEVSLSYYFPSGRLLQHTWNNSNYSISLNTGSGFSYSPVNMDNLCTTMCVYLEELAKLLETAPGEAFRCSTVLPRSTDVVRALLSEIINDVTISATTPVETQPENVNSSEEVAREVIVEIINQMSLS